MKKRAIIYNQNKTMQQKNYSELTRHTATLITVLLQWTRRLPQAFTQNPRKRKRESRLPCGASSLCATAPRVPPAWGTGLVPARARVAGPCLSGFGPSPPQPRDSSATLSTTQLPGTLSTTQLSPQKLRDSSKQSEKLSLNSESSH